MAILSCSLMAFAASRRARERHASASFHTSKAPRGCPPRMRWPSNVPRNGGNGSYRIAVPRLPRIANFDDLDPLRLEPGVTHRHRPARSADPARCRSDHHSRLQIDDRRSRRVARGRLGYRHHCPCPSRRQCARSLRRLSDAWPHYPRSATASRVPLAKPQASASSTS